MLLQCPASQIRLARRIPPLRPTQRDAQNAQKSRRTSRTHADRALSADASMSVAPHLSAPSSEMPTHLAEPTLSRAHATVLLALQAIRANGWILARRLPTDDAWTASALSYSCVMLRSASSSSSCCGRAAMRLRFVPLFDSIRLSGTLHIDATADTDSALPPSLPALSDAITQSTMGIDIPHITISNIWPKDATLEFDPQGSTSLASVAPETLAQAVANLHAQMFESAPAEGSTSAVADASRSESWWSRVESLVGRASAQSLDESLFCDFSAFVLRPMEPHEQTADAALPASTPAATAVAHRPRLAPFSSESTVTPRNACVTLVHLLLLYEGFRPAEEQQLEAAGRQASIDSASQASAASSSSSSSPSLSTFASMAPPAHPSESWVPSNWVTFRSDSSVYSLSYQHLSLQAALPRHRVRVKIVPLFDETMTMHMQLLPDCAWPTVATAGAAAVVEEQSTSAKEGAVGSEVADAADVEAEPAPSPPPAVVSPKIYSMTLRCPEFLSASFSQSVAASLDPHTSFVHVGALLSQLRNRILKHMLGANYRRVSAIASSVSHSASASSSTATAASKPSLDALPPELLLGVLSSLSSSEVLAVGHTAWSMHYLSLHSWIWRALCKREHPLPGDSASTSTLTDWKNAFRVRKQLKQQQQARDAERDRNLRQLLGSDPLGLFGPGGLDRLGQARWMPRGGGIPPRPFPFHPFPGAVHPDAPFFTMPGRRS